MSGSITYRQLQPEERITIAGLSLTISRELARNTGSNSSYASHLAQLTCRARQRTRRPTRPIARLHVDGLRWGLVLTMLNWNWSPQRIAGALRRAFSDQPKRHVSHETIYTAI